MCSSEVPVRPKIKNKERLLGEILKEVGGGLDPDFLERFLFQDEQ